ncbi:MAG: c-type cytochrome [Gemmatimonadota bacterium]
MSRSALRSIVALALGLPLLAAVHAGGWATVSVENLPDNLIAGQPTNLTFSGRQHGKELLSDLTPTAVMRSGRHEVNARAVATNRKGFYMVTLRPPAPGDWEVTIHPGFHRAQLKLLPIPALAGQTRAVSYSPEQRGQRLFAARSCVSCHVHARVPESGYYDFGPELTTRRFPREYLEQFLANPDVKPIAPGSMRMPNPRLEPAEIDALIAFINDVQSKQEVSAVR